MFFIGGFSNKHDKYGRDKTSRTSSQNRENTPTHARHQIESIYGITVRPGCKRTLSVGKSPAHDAPDARLKEVRHLGLAEAVLVPVAPDVTDVVDDAAVTRDE